MSREGSHWACYPESAASWSNSGQAFQSLDQPDHRQRIPVTVVEQVSPDSVSFVLRNLSTKPSPVASPFIGPPALADAIHQAVQQGRQAVPVGLRESDEAHRSHAHTFVIS